MLRTKCTVQRCQGQARTRAIAAFSPSWWSEIAKPHAVPGRAPAGAQELDPEGLGLDLADVDPDHLAAARLVDGVGDDQRLGAHVAAVADLELLGVQPQVGVGALQRPLAEGVDLLVELRGRARRRGPWSSRGCRAARPGGRPCGSRRR